MFQPTTLAGEYSLVTGQAKWKSHRNVIGGARFICSGVLLYHNCRRYQEVIGNVAPTDGYHGRREQILGRRAEQKLRTIPERLRYNLGRSNLKLTGVLNAKV
jgi:hypothetical protein